jgi:hypothetical protein
MLLSEKQNGRTVYKSLTELKLEDKVCIKYRHPDELGFFMENTFTRFNEQDLEDRIIEGKIYKIDLNTREPLFWIKQDRTNRNFIFYENEMEWIERRL